MSEYPLITYLDKTYGVSTKKDARKITKHLAVAYANAKGGDRSIKIYSIYGHREVMPHSIATYQDAIQFCQFLEQQYGEYWEIHRVDNMEDFDIIQVAQYSIESGERIYSALKKLENRTGVALNSEQDSDTITYSEFMKALDG